MFTGVDIMEKALGQGLKRGYGRRVNSLGRRIKWRGWRREVEEGEVDG
jgi:hypothetical protein